MDKKIAVFGAGAAGKHLVKQIQDHLDKIVELVGVIDTYAAGEVLGVPVYTPGDFFRKHPGDTIDCVIIAAGAQRTLKKMMDSLCSYNVKNIYRIKDVVGKNKLEIFDGEKVINNRIQKISFSEEKPTLPYFEIPITDSCNLNCTGCLFGCNTDASQEHIPFDVIAKDIKRMSELFEDIPWIRILGGEPLLHPDITEIIKEVRKYFPNSDVDVCTNGLKIPKMSDDFFKCVVENNISVHISGYPPTYKMFTAIEERLDEYGIDAVTLDRAEFFKFYTLEPENDKKQSYENCMTSACREVYKGRISNCSGVIAFEKMNAQFGTKYEIIAGEDYINIHNEDITGWDIIRTLDKATNACRYCNTLKMQKFDWEAAKKQPAIEDYII